MIDNKTRSKQEGRNAKENSSKNNNERETVVNLDPPTKTEIQLALTQLKNGTAARLDNISPEVLKVDSCRNAISSTRENMEGREDP